MLHEISFPQEFKFTAFVWIDLSLYWRIFWNLYVENEENKDGADALFC